MTDHNYNLDDGVVEYFEFIVKGHKYRFRHPNTEELDEIRLLTKDQKDKGGNETLYKFITKVDESSPDLGDPVAVKITVENFDDLERTASQVEKIVNISTPT